MKNKRKLKDFPKFKSDKEAEEFVEQADLTEYDFSGFAPVKFEFANKSARINMRLPEDLLVRIKQIAEEEQVPYTRFIRQVLEAEVSRKRRSS